MTYYSRYRQVYNSFHYLNHWWSAFKVKNALPHAYLLIFGSMKQCIHITYRDRTVTGTSNGTGTVSRCNATYSIFATLMTYLYCMTKYTQIIPLAILIAQVREEIARIHPIQAMEQGVQPHLQVKKMLLWQFVGIVGIPCSKTAETITLH